MGNSTAEIEQRWPKLQRLRLESGSACLGKLLAGGWLHTPAFLDSGERALRTLARPDVSEEARHVLDGLAQHTAAQTREAKCLEALTELIAGGWLADLGVLTTHEDSGLNPNNQIIDLVANVGGSKIGVEVKADFDAFESEFMSGSFQGDPDALGTILENRFGV